MRKMTNRILYLMMIVMLITVSFTGCNNGGSKVSKDTNKKVENTGSGNTSTEKIKDMMGREVTIPAKVEKIVNVGSVGVLNGFVQLMGYGDKIAHQMPANFTKTDQWKYQNIFSPQIKDLPVIEVAKEINMEKVLEIKPDICFTMSKDSVKTLESKGLNVVYLSWTKPEDAKECINLLGKLLKKEDVAKKYNDYFDGMVKKASEKIKNIKDKKTVLYGNVAEFTQPHIIAEWWIKQAGGVSVTDNGRKEEQFKYQMEDLLKWNPDVIIASNEKTKKELESNDKFKSLKAVTDKKVYVTPTIAHVWANRTIEQPLMIMWTMHKLYPEVSTREELSKDIHGFYKEFFNYEMSADEINRIMDK